MVAYPWIASSLTRSPLLLSLIGLMASLPWLIVSLPGGVLIDRFPRRKIIVLTDVFRGFVTVAVAVVIWANQNSIHVVKSVTNLTVVNTHLLLYCVMLVATFLLESAAVIGNSASQTFIPMIVDKEELERANGRLWTAESLTSSFMGPPLASLLLGLSVFAPLAFDGASFFFSAGLIGAISRIMIKPQAKSEKVPNFRAELKEGLTWLWRHDFLRPLAMILGSLNFVGAIYNAVFILFAQEDLHTTVFTFGLLMTGVALGGTLGGLLSAKIIKKCGRSLILTLTILGMPVTFIATAFSTRWEIVWFFSGLEMFFAILWNVVTVSMRQEIIPDHLLGRVNSAYRFFALGTQPIGALVGGLTVTFCSHVFSRGTALRSPMIVAAALGLVLATYALPHLTTAKIDAARGKSE
jgi:MFS family permease